MLNGIPPFLKNFYVLGGLCFLVWMTFLDSNDLITRFTLRSKLRNLKEEKAYYLDKIEEVKTDRKELMTNNDLLEKFAREKYLMRRESEDVFIIEEEQ